MSTIQRQVAASDDDAVEDDSGADFNSTDTNVFIRNSSIAGVRTNGGFRFLNITVPKAAVITAASIEVWPRQSAGDDPDDCTIRGNNVDNSANFTTEPDVTSRALTTASVAWPGTNIGISAYKTSPDISTIIQEIVNRAGWASGNALMIIIKGRAGGTTSFDLSAWDQTSGAEAAKLNITYASSGGSGGGGQGQGKGTGGGSSGGSGGIGKDKDKGGGKGPPGTIDRYLVASRSRRRIGVL